MERGGWDVAPLEEDALSVTPGVVARLAIDSIPLVAAIDHRRIDRHRDRGDELSVRALAGEEVGILLEPTDRNRSRYTLAHRCPVVEVIDGGLREDLWLIVHARVEMDRRLARRAAARTAGEGDHGR